MNKLAALAVLLVGCGSSRGGEVHAVGTYIGGGSYLFGSDDCTYSGAPGVFTDGDGAQPGPRMVRAPGKITITCPKTTRDVTAVAPSGAKIWAEPKMKVGEQQLITANLVSDGEDLRGEASIEWHLGKDCESIAEFGPVMGAQDTGGKDRSRDLIAKAKGSCQVTVMLATGSALDPAPGKAFQTSVLVTIN